MHLLGIHNLFTKKSVSDQILFYFALVKLTNISLQKLLSQCLQKVQNGHPSCRLWSNHGGCSKRQELNLANHIRIIFHPTLIHFTLLLQHQQSSMLVKDLYLNCSKCFHETRGAELMQKQTCQREHANLTACFKDAHSLCFCIVTLSLFINC